MTDYPTFIQQGYDMGSGPTESFGGCLTKRLEGAGMRRDKDNGEAAMALANLCSSHLWNNTGILIIWPLNSPEIILTHYRKKIGMVQFHMPKGGTFQTGAMAMDNHNSLSKQEL